MTSGMNMTSSYLVVLHDVVVRCARALQPGAYRHTRVQHSQEGLHRDFSTTAAVVAAVLLFALAASGGGSGRGRRLYQRK